MYTVLLRVSEVHAWTFGETPTVYAHGWDYPAMWKRVLLEEIAVRCAVLVGEA